MHIGNLIFYAVLLVPFGFGIYMMMPSRRIFGRRLIERDPLKHSNVKPQQLYDEKALISEGGRGDPGISSGT